MQRIQIPRDAERILEELETAGFQAYVVGGCVRDSLMGRIPKDWDITTSAEPQDVKRIFRNTYDTGIEHGTVSVRFGTEIYEVTTFRVDGVYTDHRRPDTVQYTGSLREDLKRRDFTMNAMAYHPRTGVVDLFQGQEDLRAGRIRCVGDARERFEEDALRMLRAYRFAARFGFEIEENTERAIREKAPLLANVSRERVREEMEQLLVSEHPEALRELAASGLMAQIIPEWMESVGVPQKNRYHCYTVEEHTIRTVAETPAVRVVRWAALLHDIAKPRCRVTDAAGIDHFTGHPEMGAEMADGILRRLKFDNAAREAIVLAVRMHDTDPPETDVQMRQLLSVLPDGFYPYLEALQRADALAHSVQSREESLRKLERAHALYETVLERGECVKLADLAVGGRDLMEIGYPRGRMIGTVLNLLLQQVLEKPQVNNKELLLQVAAQLKEKIGTDPEGGKESQ